MITNTRLSFILEIVVKRFQMVFDHFITFIVSKGCPAKTRHIPPNPPAIKSFIGLIDVLSGIFGYVVVWLSNLVENWNTQLKLTYLIE